MNAETMLLQIHQIQLIYASAVRGAIRQSACSHVHCFDIPINHCMWLYVSCVRVNKKSMHTQKTNVVLVQTAIHFSICY